ncbi:MAG: sensor histidine kinase, partial [Bacteroidota bacterium]
MLTRTRLYWGLQIGGWTFYALIEIITSWLASGDAGVSPERVMFLSYEGLSCLVLTHIFRLIAIRRNWLESGLTRASIRVIISVMIMSMVMVLLRIPAAYALGLFDPGAFTPNVFFGLSAVYSVIFFLWTVIYFIYHYFDRFNKSLKLEASVREIELNNLKSQLNPHFIFNALNSIRALIDEDPVRAKQAVTQLSNLLRSSLSTGKKGLTPLDEELRIVHDYIGLEMIRFEERLKTDFDIGPESFDFSVPPLMIQTLMENGIKHGISKLKEGGLIQLKTRVNGDRLSIQIRNSGQYI